MGGTRRCGAGSWLTAGFIAILAASGCGHSVDISGGGSTPPVPNGPEFAYVSNSGDGLISQFAIDAKKGTLQFIAQTAAGGAGLKGLAATSGLLYAANESSGQIFGFKINPKSGELTPTAQGNVSTGAGTGPLTLAISSGGSFLYAVDTIGDQIFPYSINKSDGALKLLAEGPQPTGKGPVSIAIATTGQALFVANQTDGTIEGFTIAKNGALAVNGEIVSLGTAAGIPQWLSNDPGGGPNIYNADAGGLSGGSVAVFKIATGQALTFVGAFGTGNSSGAPLAVAVNPAIQFVYTANGNATGSSTIYQITATGLSHSATVTGIPSANSVAIDQTGAFIFYSDNTDAVIFQGTINQTTGNVTANSQVVDTEKPPNSASSPFQVITMMTPAS